MGMESFREVAHDRAEQEPTGVAVVGIYISEGKGQPMVHQDYVVAREGLGLEGQDLTGRKFNDRYHKNTRRGTYSGQEKPHRVPDENWRNITIITQEGIQEAADELRGKGFPPFYPFETRRNVVIAGMTPAKLDALVTGEQSIWLGEVEIKIMEQAVPCNVPSKQYEKNDFLRVFKGRGGVRGVIVNTGKITTGDRVSLTLPKDPSGKK